MTKFTKEITLLKQHYQTCYNQIKDINFYRLFAEEKIHHCQQVIGAGNYIIKHEPTFMNRDPEFIRWAQLAYVFHDIGRFVEIVELYDHEKATGENAGWKPIFDHGEFGCEILRKIPEYNDIRLWLPVRHHGHMIEQFYADTDYQAQKHERQKQLRDIIFLTRDADKIANFYLLKTADSRFNELFYCSNSDEYTFGKINPEIIGLFEKNEVIPRHLVNSLADSILNTISWVFDLNYRPSFDFTERHQVIQALFKTLQNYNSELILQKKLASSIQKYIHYRYQQF